MFGTLLSLGTLSACGSGASEARSVQQVSSEQTVREPTASATLRCRRDDIGAHCSWKRAGFAVAGQPIFLKLAINQAFEDVLITGSTDRRIAFRYQVVQPHEAGEQPEVLDSGSVEFSLSHATHEPFWHAALVTAPRAAGELELWTEDSALNRNMRGRDHAQRVFSVYRPSTTEIEVSAGGLTSNRRASGISPGAYFGVSYNAQRLDYKKCAELDVPRMVKVGFVSSSDVEKGLDISDCGDSRWPEEYQLTERNHLGSSGSRRVVHSAEENLQWLIMTVGTPYNRRYEAAHDACYRTPPLSTLQQRGPQVSCIYGTCPLHALDAVERCAD